MRQEDKEVDGFELEQAEERKRESELIEDDEEQLTDLDGKPEHERDEERSTSVVGAMHKILEGEHIVLNDLKLPQRELKALEALKTAVEGRDQNLNGFVYAEDRRTLLEQALAVLQPDLAKLETIGGKPFEDMVKDVAELRGKLNVLEDAQEEVAANAKVAAKGEAGDTEDKPKPDDDQSLTGPERKIEKPASSLTGAEPKIEKPKSALSEGPALAEPANQPTTLGDPSEIAQAVPPWWKR